MTSIMLSAVLVMGLTSPAYADDESPTGCTNNQVAQGFDTTDKITAVGQNIEVLTATIGNPSQINATGFELSCDYTVTAQEVVVDVNGIESQVLIAGGTDNCVGDTIVAGDNFHVCTFVPGTGYESLITDLSIGDFWRLTLKTSRDVAVHNGAQNVATNSDNTELKPSDATLTKAVNPDKILKGVSTSVTYTYVATNTAASVLTCGLVDDKLGVIYAPKAFASGASDTSTKTTTLTAGVTNIATLTCVDQAGITFTRTATTTVTDIDPQVTLEKSVNPDKISAGVPTAVVYSYLVKNTGDTNLNCVVTDDKIDTIGTTGTLTPGASQTLTKGATISNAVTNIGTVTCTAQIGGATATATATVREINPSILVDKTCTPLTQTEPGTIDYTIVVTNNGNTLLTGVVLTDATLGISKNIGNLAPAASDTTTASATGLVAGTYTNTADAEGVDQLQTKVTFEDSSTCIVEGGGAEGLTPGFWKANAEKWDAGAWVSEDPVDLFNDVFKTSVVLKLQKQGTETSKGTPANPTLFGAMSVSGGGENRLAFHCVAAKLNAEHPDISYPMTTDQVIKQCGDALNSGDKDVMDTLKNTLDANNNLGADISQHWPDP